MNWVITMFLSLFLVNNSSTNDSASDIENVIDATRVRIHQTLKERINKK